MEARQAAMRRFTYRDHAKHCTILSQWTATHEIVGADEFKSYGDEFEKAYTTKPIRASTRHQRIISYRFGDLNLVKLTVRHETCAFVNTCTKSPSSNAKLRVYAGGFW